MRSSAEANRRHFGERWPRRCTLRLIRHRSHHNGPGEEDSGRESQRGEREDPIASFYPSPSSLCARSRLSLSRCNPPCVFFVPQVHIRTHTHRRTYSWAFFSFLYIDIGERERYEFFDLPEKRGFFGFSTTTLFFFFFFFFENISPTSPSPRLSVHLSTRTAHHLSLGSERRFSFVTALGVSYRAMSNSDGCSSAAAARFIWRV